MLTDSEKQWIEQREAMQFLTGTYIADFEEYPLWNPGKDWQEAAEFEARVAAKLALGCESQTPCNGCWRANWKFCNLRKGFWDCADCFLKAARLAVEEKMDADEERTGMAGRQREMELQT